MTTFQSSSAMYVLLHLILNDIFEKIFFFYIYLQQPQNILIYMSIYFAEVHDSVMHIKGAVHHRDSAESVSKAIMWFLGMFPGYAVDRMLVPPVDSTEIVTCIPLNRFRDWDYRLPVRVLVVTFKLLKVIEPNTS